MGRRVSCRFIALCAIAMAIAACAARPDAPRAEPEPAPIAAGDAGSHPVVFQKTLFRIPVGTPLSVTRLRGRIVDERNWESSTHETGAFNVTATDELKRLGYDVRDASDSVFTPSSTLEARYQMAAIVHTLAITNDVKPSSGPAMNEYEKLSSQATMNVEFQLFDTLDKKLVVKKRVQGRGVDPGRTGQPMPSAFLAAFRKALADPGFVAPLRRSTGGAPGLSFADHPLAVTPCPDRALTLPGDLPRAQDAVVVVIVGSGSGAGTVVSDDGYVLTAAHVIGAEEKPVLRFKSGFELPAEVVRVDSGRDAALLKVPGRGHACLRTEHATVGVGTEIWAIGNPIAEELARSVTRGIASGNRTIRGRSYLQTDAAVNPGNSGGPLLDTTGQLRGIVVRKLSEEGIEGLGFAVPIADAERALGLSWREAAETRPDESGPVVPTGSVTSAPGGAPRAPR